MSAIRLVDGQYLVEVYKGCILALTPKQMKAAIKAGKALKRRQTFQARMDKAQSTARARQ